MAFDLVLKQLKEWTNSPGAKRKRCKAGETWKKRGSNEAWRLVQHKKRFIAFSGDTGSSEIGNQLFHPLQEQMAPALV